MADSCTSNFNENSVALRRGCFTKKKHVIIESFAVLRRSVSLLGRFIIVWKTGHKHNQLLVLQPCGACTLRFNNVVLAWLQIDFILHFSQSDRNQRKQILHKCKVLSALCYSPF